MAIRQTRAKLKAVRNSSGSAIVEGTCGTVLILGIAVPLFLFFGNVAAQLSLQAQVSHIANQAAQACDNGRYWLGQPRPGFTEQVASEEATAVAQELCERVGLKGASVNVKFESNNPNFDVTVCDVNVNAVGKIPFRTTAFGFDLAKLFPGNVSARGVAAHAKVKPYALIHMDAPTREDQSVTRPLGYNERDVAVIPAYGFFYNASAGAPNTIATPYGKGLAPNLSPENFIAMNHYHLKKTDIEHVMATGQDVPISAWHYSTRFFNR